MLKISSIIFTLSLVVAMSATSSVLAQIETFPSPYEGTILQPHHQGESYNNNNNYNTNNNNIIQPYGSNQNNETFTTNWGQSTITWGQLQNIFLTHPNNTLFLIRFPNGFSWKVDPVALQSLYTNMVGTTTGMGLIGAADMIFNSTTQQLAVTCCVAYTSQPYTR